MTSPIRAIPLLALIVLAACATPRERCLQEATRDLRVIDGLILETEATIQRGYAVRTVREPETFFRLCVGTPYNASVWGRFCSRTEWVERSTPVAVDLREERRKLVSLRAKRTEVLKRAALEQAACPAA